MLLTNLTAAQLDAVVPLWRNLISSVQVHSEKILHAGKVLRNAILSASPHMIRDRKYHLKTNRLDVDLNKNIKN